MSKKAAEQFLMSVMNDSALSNGDRIAAATSILAMGGVTPPETTPEPEFMTHSDGRTMTCSEALDYLTSRIDTSRLGPVSPVLIADSFKVDGVELAKLVKQDRDPICHEVKCLPDQFAAAWRGDKRFSYRFNDRDYRVGDILRKMEWTPDGGYTGKAFTATIRYVLDGGFGLPDGYVVLSLDN
jgi:hypothetical protein